MLLWFNKDKPDAEGSEKKKETETETLIFSETTAARQKVPDETSFFVVVIFFVVGFFFKVFLVEAASHKCKGFWLLLPLYKYYSLAYFLHDLFCNQINNSENFLNIVATIQNKTEFSRSLV